MKPTLFLAFALAAVAQLPAAEKRFESTTSKPNVFGEIKTVTKDSSGRTVGESTAAKPNVFGETKTVTKDSSGLTIGGSTIGKPNVFGETKTVTKGDPGQTAPRKK